MENTTHYIILYTNRLEFNYPKCLNSTGCYIGVQIPTATFVLFRTLSDSKNDGFLGSFFVIINPKKPIK